MNAFFSGLFDYAFLSRALLTGLLVSLCAALLGTNLVLKRLSMIGDGLSHIAFGSITVALAAGVAPLYLSIPIVLLSAFWLLRIRRSSRMGGDAAIALVSSSAMAIGVVVLSFSSGMNIDVYNYMFGSILAMRDSDVVLSIVCAAAVLTLYLLFYHRIFAVTFDEAFASATGVRAGGYQFLLAALSACIIVVGMRIMGALLISSLLVFPSLSAMRICKSYRGVTVAAACLSVVCFFIGLMLSFVYSTPAGASVVVVNLASFLLCATASRLKAGRRKTVFK